MIEAKTIGFAEAEKQLSRTLPKTAKKALRSGVAKGSRLLAKRAKSRVHKGHGGVPGLLKKSIGQKVKVYKRGEVVGIIGPRKGFLHILKGGERVDPAKYGHIEEKGRKVVIAKRKRVLSDGKSVFGKSVPAYKGRPFLKPTLDQDGQAAQDEAGKGIADTLEREAPKK